MSEIRVKKSKGCARYTYLSANDMNVKASSKKKYLYWILLFVLLMMPHTALCSQTPRFLNLGIDLNDVIPLVENTQLLLLHPTEQIIREVKNKKRTYDAQFVSSAVIMNGSVDHIRATIMDIEKYPDFLPQFAYSKILEKSDKVLNARFKMVLAMPVFTPKVNLDLEYTQEPDGGISWSLISGDVDVSEGRWEFVPLSDNQTLVILTNWMDMRSKFINRMMIKVQPDLETTVPISTASITTYAIKTRVEAKIPGKPDKHDTPEGTPTIPLLTNTYMKRIARLASYGTVMFVHPEQKFKSHLGLVDLTFVSGGGIVRCSLDDAKKFTTQFNRYREFNESVKNATITNKKDGFFIDFEMKLGGNILSVSIDYTLDFTWLSENKLVYRVVKGDVTHIYGIWEWIPLENDRTLLMHTGAYRTGEDDSILLRLGDKLPNGQIIVGANVNLVVIEKQIPWIEKQITASKDPSCLANTAPEDSQ